MPEKLINGRLQGGILQVPAERLVAGGLSDFQGDEAADGAQLLEAGIEAVFVFSCY